MQNALGYMNLDDFIKPHTDELLKRSDYKAKLKQVTTFIRLHLGREDSTRFVDDLDTYDPKSLWDSIISHYATKSIENAANVMEKLHDIVFVEGEMQKSINLFRQTFHLMIEVSNSKFDKKTLEAVWVFFILKRLPASYSVFRTLQFSTLKSGNSEISMTTFLKDLELELRRQQDTANQLSATATALAVQQAPRNSQHTQGTSSSNQKRQTRRPVCSNGTHNPATAHSEDDCHQLHPEKAIAYFKAAIDRVNNSAAKRALLSANSGVSDEIVLDSGASGHYLKHRHYFITFRPLPTSVYGANGSPIPILGVGTAVIQSSKGPITIPNAYFAPSLSNSLISLTFFIKQGYSIIPKWAVD